MHPASHLHASSRRMRRMHRLARAMVLVLGGTSLPAAAQTVFGDGFEAAAHLACLDGPLPADHLGPLPAGTPELLGCIALDNDAGTRSGEIARGGIALPRAAALGEAGFDRLVLAAPGALRLPLQVRTLSRWGAPLADTAAPVRWLEVAFPAELQAGSGARYALLRYPAAVSADDPRAVLASEVAGLWQIDTGAARFRLDPQSAALLASIELRDDQGQFHTIYQHLDGSPGFGPRLSAAGAGLARFDAGNALPGTLVVDGFSVQEAGTVQVVVQLDGHFNAAGGLATCAANPNRGPYPAFPFTALLRLARAQAAIELEWHVVNACSDEAGSDWTDQAAEVFDLGWDFSFVAGADAAYRASVAGIGPAHIAAAGDLRPLAARQDRGGGTPWQRRARLLRGDLALASGEALLRPQAGFADDGLVAALHAPWLRYREPQGLSLDGRRLGFDAVAEPVLLGEGKGLWFATRLELALPDASAPAERLAGWRQGAHDALERGLTPHLAVDDMNRSGLLPPLAAHSEHPAGQALLAFIEGMHERTVADTPCSDPLAFQGAQWTCAKTYGQQIWPDVQFSQMDGYSENASPAENDLRYNYWNPSGTELLAFLRSGELRWLWDFALPQSWLQAHTATLNTAVYAGSARNGFAVASGGSGDGHWHRGSGGSDDYSYNRGQHLAYAIRPGHALRNRFAQAGATVLARYAIPRQDQALRDPFFNAVTINRGTFQHFEGLANCAEFVPGAAGEACHARLMELLQELGEDNFPAGPLCFADVPGDECFAGQQFMVNAMFHGFLLRLYLNYGDLVHPADGRSLLRRALVEAPRTYLEYGIARLPDQGIDVGGTWHEAQLCQLDAGRSNVLDCQGVDIEGGNLYAEYRPSTLALLLQAAWLGGDATLCAQARSALDALFPGGGLGPLAGWARGGWWKGAALASQGLAEGLGSYAACVAHGSPAEAATARSGTASDPGLRQRAWGRRSVEGAAWRAVAASSLRLH